MRKTRNQGTTKRHPAITAAWITGACAIIAASVAVFLSKSPQGLFGGRISEDRRQILTGTWEGTLSQEYRGLDVDVPCVLELSAGSTEIDGQLLATHERGDRHVSTRFDVSGTLVHDRFVKVDFVSPLPGTVHFGVMILELAPAGNRVAGRYVAFGTGSEEIIHGEAIFRKAP